MATTWTATGSRSVKAVCTTGTEAAPTLATEGMQLDSVDGFTLYLAADAGQTITGGTSLKCYLRNRIDGVWARFADWDVSLGAGNFTVQETTFAGPSAGKGWPIIDRADRLAFVPSGVTVSSGNVTLFHNASSLAAGAL